MEDKNEAKKITFDGAIMEVNSALLKSPNALSISLRKDEGRHFYNWNDNSIKAKTTRKEIRRILQGLWQSGAYNYQQIADALRVDVLSIQGILDEDFLFRNPHLK